MRNEEIKAELSALRAEVVALAEARKLSESTEATQQQPTAESDDDTEVIAEQDGCMRQGKELV